MAAPKLETADIRHKVLLAEDQTDIVNIIRFAIESDYNFDIYHAKTGFEAIEIINKNKDLSLILCDHSMDPGNARTVYDFLKDQELDIPFVFTSGETVQNFKGFEEAEEVKGVNKKQLLQKLPEIVQAFFEVDMKVPPKEFTGIGVETLLAFTQLHEDVYIQLSSGRYLKYYSQSDSLDIADINHLRRKGVSKLFLKQESLTWMKREVVENFPDIVEGKTQLGQLQLRNQVYEEKVTVSSPFEYEKEFLQEVEAERDATLRKISMNPRLRALLKRLKLSKDQYYNEHINLLCNISCSIAKNMNWSTSETMQKMIYASYLHDILFADHTHLAEIRDIHQFENEKGNLSDYERKVFLENPNYVTQIAREDSKAPADVEHILLQHRELPDGSGFPRGLKHHQMNAMACLFIIAHDFVDELYMDSNLGLQDYVKKAREKFKGSHFDKITMAILNTGNAGL